MARARKPDGELDLELEDLPAPARWREWMGRVEAVIFASAEPVLRESLARVVGRRLQPRSDHRRYSRRIARASLRARLRRRRMELSDETGVWRRHPGRARRPAKGRIVAIECACPDGDRVFSADHPRGAVAVFGTGGFAETRSPRCAAKGFIAAGPRSPTPGAPYAYVTTPGFLAQFGFESLARPAGHREARGRGAARPDERGASRRRRAWRPS